MKIRLAEKQGLQLNKYGYISGGSYIYKVTEIADSDTIETVLSTVRTTAPATIGVSYRDQTTLDSVDGGLHPSQAVVRVSYTENSYSERTETDSTFAFDISGQNKHISVSLSTVRKAPATAPYYDRAININAQGEIEGVDVISDVFTFSETHYYSNSQITAEYKKSLAELVGCVNNADFKGFSAGEVMFQGVSGQRSGDDANDKWVLTFRFAVSLNRTGVTVGSLNIGNVDGWDYLWIKYKETVVNNVKKQIAQYAYVERVYERKSFATLV